MHRQCRSCEAIKPIEEFDVVGIGRWHRCKVCRDAQKSKRWQQRRGTGYGRACVSTATFKCPKHPEADIDKCKHCALERAKEIEALRAKVLADLEKIT